MIVRDALLGADTLFGRFELEGVVCYPSADNKSCCLSAKTDDDLVYLYVKYTPEEEYDGKEFGIRRWYSLHSILNLTNDRDSIDMRLEVDEFNYPKTAYFTIGNTRITHYLQNFTFISNQDSLLNLYKRKKFELNNNDGTTLDSISSEDVKILARFSTMLNEKYFRIGKTEGHNCLYIGDMNQSIDCAKIILNITNSDNWDETKHFSVEYFNILYRALGGDESVKVRFTKDKIIMSKKEDNFVKIGIIVGKNM